MLGQGLQQLANHHGLRLGRQYELTVESPRSGKVELFQLGEKTYEHVLILPSKSKGLGPHLTTQNLIDFMADAGNVIVALSADLPVPTAVSTLLRELEIHVPPHRPEKVVDHHEHDEQSAAESHDVLLLPGTGLVRAGDSPLLEVAGTIAVPRAVGHRLGNDSPLLSRVLAASPNAYSYSAEDEDEGIEKVFGSGCQLGIVSVVQARNSARLAVVGSAEMLQNDWFDGTVKRAGKVQKTANREFARKLFAWTYQELGVLRVGKLEHYLTDPASAAPARGSNGTSLAERAVNPKIYRIKNEVVSVRV